MQPYDYTIDVRGPFESAVRGYQFGAAIQEQEAQRQAAQQQAEAQQQMARDLAGAASDPSRVPALMVKYPQLAEKLKHGWDAMKAEQQQALLSHASEVFSALHVGRADVAVNVLKKRAEAQQASGDEQGAKATLDMVKWAESDPDSLKGSLALRLGAVPGGDKVIKAVTDLGKESREAAQAPAELRQKNAAADKAVADAATAQAQAKFAEPTAKAASEKATADAASARSDAVIKAEEAKVAPEKAKLTIAKLKADIGLTNQQAATAAQLLKKYTQEMQLSKEEAMRKVETDMRAKVSEFESGISTLADAKQLIKEIRSNKAAFNSATGMTAGTAWIPGSPEKAVAGKMEQLQNILALPGLDKLKGPTSDKDIAFLRNIATNLDRYQGTAAVNNELTKIDAALDRLAKAAAKKYGAPEPNLDRGPVTPIPGWGAGANQPKNVVVDW